VGEYVAPYLKNTETDLDDVLLPIIRRGIKIIIWVVALIVALDNAGYNITTMLAGLGVGGLAFALAAKDSVENFFGGFTIFTDKPFGLKDRIKVAGFDGTVTEIGMRSTRIKTLEGRIVTIPNSSIANDPIENISSEPSRKVVSNLGLTYDMDQTKVAEAMKIVREIADDHKEAIEENLSVGFTAFGDFALNILFIYYIRKDSNILDTKTAINMDILKRFNAAGLEFAFPSQTIYTKALD
jgi:MscS family membrane protein